MPLPATSKERGFIHHVKMDAVNLNFIWPNFPQGKVVTGHGRTYAGRYLLAAEMQRMEDEWLAKHGRRDKKFKVKQLLDIMMERLEQEESINLALFLADV